jgi:hypothetical protein
MMQLPLPLDQQLLKMAPATGRALPPLLCTDPTNKHTSQLAPPSHITKQASYRQ